MSETITAEKRDLKGQKPNFLRKNGLIPCELYGHKVGNEHLAVEYSKLAKILRSAGENQIILMKVADEAKPRNVMIKSVEYNNKTNKISHVDFHQIRLDEAITVEVPLNFIGKSEAQEILGGSLVKNLHQLKIKALPAKLPSQINIDISGLKTFDDKILVKNIKLDNDLEVLNNSEDVIAVVAPHVEEEIAPPTTEAESLENIEVAKKESKAESETQEAPDSSAGAKPENKQK